MIRELHYDTVFDAQRHFRVLLDCMARPGKIQILDDVTLETPQELSKAVALIGLALLDADATFWVNPVFNNIAEYFNLNTGSHLAEVNNADFIFMNGMLNLNDIEDVKIGNLQYPEQGVTLVIQIEKISNQPMDDAISIELRGPGVQEFNPLFIKGVTMELLEFIQFKNEEFPLGVDVILTDTDDNITCIPRSNQIMIKK
jgi:alpha-D-ribose 1-methylphosphonate 5-triphosphate synthase subunit PhnH